MYPKQAMNKIWAKRESQISILLNNITGMIGSIEGLNVEQHVLMEFDTPTLEAIAPDDQENENSDNDESDEKNID